MSILIKGLRMPRDCGECVLCDAVKDDEYDYVINIYCHVTGESLESLDMRGDRCPLVPVPTPHGRLIDASTKIEAQLYDEMTEEWSVATAAVDDFLAFAADLPPTIIEAEGEDHERAD